MPAKKPNVSQGNIHPKPLQRRDPLVDQQTFTVEWKADIIPGSRYSTGNRRLTERVGVSLPTNGNKNRGSLGFPRKDNAHKCIGNESSGNSSEIGYKGQVKSIRTCKSRQCYSNQIHKQNGRDQIPKSDKHSKTNMGILPKKGDHTDGGAPTRLTQSHCGWGEQACVEPIEFKQLETQSRSVQTNYLDNGPNLSGPVCREDECPSGTIHQLETGSLSNRDRCISDNMGGEGCLCLPPILSDPKMLGKSADGKGPNGDNNTSMAKSSLLSIPPRDVSSEPDSIAPTERFATISKGRVPPTNSEQNSEISGMENFRKSKELQGLSAESSKLLLSAWRKGTQSAAGDSGLAGVVRDKLILFRPLWKI